MNSVVIMWVLFATELVAEAFLVYAKLTPLFRRYVAYAVLFMATSVHTMLLLHYVNLLALILFVIGLYRAVNIARVGYGRMHQSYLSKATRCTSLLLATYQLPFVLALTLLNNVEISIQAIITGLSVAIGVHACMLVAHAVKIMRSTRLDDTITYSKELPTVSVAIPARNETQDLQDCLELIIKSDYPKVEIVVLDDCSQDRPSDVIKHFAHKGVRFVNGNEPGEDWLPKNAAYNKLLQEINGEIVLYCGVDVRVESTTVSQMVSYLLATNAAMVSVLPTRTAQSVKQSSLQQLRYLWELALPRNTKTRPPVLSTLWLARTSELKKVGGFAAVKRMVVPEAYFAALFAANNTYRFVRSSKKLGIQSVKSAEDQRLTTLRVRYPQLHKRPENVLLITMYFFIVASTVPLCFYALYVSSPILLTITGVTMFIYLVLSLIYAQSLSPNHLVLGTLQTLASPLVDMYLIHASMLQYEFGTVSWKERNVCLPVMHVTPSLPRID